MTVSHLTRSQGQLWSDLLVELGGAGSNLIMSEEELIAAAANTYGGSVSAKTSSRAELIAALVNAAGGSVSATTHSEGEMMAALANALGGSVSALVSLPNASLAASVNAAADSGAPEWVPEAFAEGIYIDLVGGSPQGRAWVFGTGEVAVETLLGADENTQNGWAVTSYDENDLTADGYVSTAVALIGAARSAVLAGATAVSKYKQVDAVNEVISPLVLLAANGNDAVSLDLMSTLLEARSYSYANGTIDEIADVGNGGLNALNGIAITVTTTRFDFAVNESAAVAGVLTETDRPPGNPFVAIAISPGTHHAMRSIGIKTTPLPTTAGLSELSANA